MRKLNIWWKGGRIKMCVVFIKGGSDMIETIKLFTKEGIKSFDVAKEVGLELKHT